MIEHVSDNASREQYETFVATHPRGHFLKSLKWANFKKPWRWDAFLCVENGIILGSMLILTNRVPKTNYSYMYCPRGPVVSDGDTETLRQLISEAGKLGERYHAYSLSMDPDCLVDDPYLIMLQNAGLVINNTLNYPAYLQTRNVYRLYLRGRSSDELFAAFHSKTRYNIRLSVKKGVTTRIGTKEDLPIFMNIMKETAARDGFLPRDLAYFEALYEALPAENLRLYLTEYRGQLLSGAIAILYGDKVWYLYGASSNQERNRMPNYQMQWEMIQWAVEQHCQYYDFRSITEDMKRTQLDGLVRFKAGFAGERCDFVGRLDLLFQPKAAKIIENIQFDYRAIVRRLLLLRDSLHKKRSCLFLEKKNRD